MLRPPLSHLSMLLVLAATLSTGAAASAQVSWRLYDLRDLIGLIPPKTPSTPEPAIDTDPGMFRVGQQSTPPTREPVVGQANNVKELMDRVCDAFGVAHSSLLAGVYGVEADDDQHAKIQALLTQVRDLYAERYKVELVWFTSSASMAPSIGDQIASPESPHRHQLVVTRRTPTPVGLVTRQSYISDLAAIVGTGAAAYDPEPKSVEDGFELSLVVGAEKEGANATAVRLAGELRRVTMGKMSVPMTFQDTTTMAIELPTVALRSIQTNLPVKYGELTVLSVLDGFEEGECVVVATSIQKLGQP